MNPNVELENFLVTRLDLNWSPPSTPGPVEVSAINCEFKVHPRQHKSDLSRIRIDLIAEFQELDTSENAVGFTARCNIAGFFLLSETGQTPKGAINALVHGGSVLYGTMRGVIASATGMFPSGKLVLPALLAKDIVKPENIIGLKAAKKKAAKKKAAKKKAAKKKAAKKKAAKKKRIG